jgi:hypothetical protein
METVDDCVDFSTTKARDGGVLVDSGPREVA